jgi:hypothetical protein
MSHPVIIAESALSALRHVPDLSENARRELKAALIANAGTLTARRALDIVTDLTPAERTALDKRARAAA